MPDNLSKDMGKNKRYTYLKVNLTVRTRQMNS